MVPPQSEPASPTSAHTTASRSGGDPPSETTALLGARARSELSPAQHRPRSTSPSRSPPSDTNRNRSTWHYSLTPRSIKKKTSAFSDRLSGRNHSSANLWATGLGAYDESTEEEGQEDGVGHFGSLMRRTNPTTSQGNGYDGEFSAQLDGGEGGNGLRMVSIRWANHLLHCYSSPNWFNTIVV